MKKRILKCIVSALVFVIVILDGNTDAFAGDINTDEQELYNFCSGVFEYEGKYYTSSQAALEALYAELMSDSRDLDEYECEAAKSLFYRNMQKGIDEGYLIEVSKPTQATTEKPSKKPGEKQTTKPSKKPNSSDQNSETTVQKESSDSLVADNNDQETTKENIFEEKTEIPSDVYVEGLDIEALNNNHNEVKDTGYNVLPVVWIAIAIICGVFVLGLYYIRCEDNNDETH